VRPLGRLKHLPPNKTEKLKKVNSNPTPTVKVEWNAEPALKNGAEQRAELSVNKCRKNNKG
jgi:hypothetical protein